MPQDLQDAFNEAGGEMPQTWGVPVEEIQRGIKFGVRKINIDTDCRIAITCLDPRDAARKNKGGVRPAQISEAGAEATRKLCKQRYEEFGAAGQARGRSSRSRSPIWPSATPAGALDPRISAGKIRRRRSDV